MELTFVENGHSAPRRTAISSCIIAGWTGRDGAAVKKHIRELEEIGVKPPSRTPVYYQVSIERLTTAQDIQVLGGDTSGEVEFTLLSAHGALWVGVGSDHTDRVAEAYEVATSKQLCEKPIAPLFWRFDDVVDHWDRLELRSTIPAGDGVALYQECSVASMLSPADLIGRFSPDGKLPEGTIMFCGTSPAIGGIRPSPLFEIQLSDPLLQREIRHGYGCHIVPKAS
jgi:hypothetical protein